MQRGLIFDYGGYIYHAVIADEWITLSLGGDDQCSLCIPLDQWRDFAGKITMMLGEYELLAAGSAQEVDNGDG